MADDMGNARLFGKRFALSAAQIERRLGHWLFVQLGPAHISLHQSALSNHIIWKD
ncbi:hypothetical protein [Pontixanthobacter sp.]|uniref:hypothetical protein n=1 Tax=Pontixanthobacter sp. TaxID=2792078 RepID=UPI003C7E025B